MYDVKMEIFRGAVCALEGIDKEFGKLQSQLGINREEWEVLVSEDYWEEPESASAARTLDKAISGCLQKAGLGAIQLPAEYVALAIAKLVSGPNWLVAAHWNRLYYDGTAAVMEGGPESRVPAKPDYMYLLTLQAAKALHPIRKGPQALADQQVKGSSSDATAKKGN